MRYFFSLFLTLFYGVLLSGCLYGNKCGISTYYYDEKKEYYDSQGNFIEECPERNMVEYPDVGMGEADSEPDPFLNEDF